MNDDRPGMLQPLVKGDNLNEFLKELIGSIVELRNLFQNFVIYDRELTQEFLKHTHYSPFYGIKGPPPLDSIDKGAEILINKITNVEVQIQAHVVALAGIQSNYLEAPGGAETIEDGVGLHILSKYNHTN